MVQYFGKYIANFKRDERGAFSIFMVGIFTTLILVAGAAIDYVRFEAVRSSIQYNLDRAVLAAASMRQTQDPETVVLDYMSKVETLSSFNVVIDQANTSVTVTGRRVAASATANLSTYFLRIAGINTLDVHATSQASEIIPNIEISLVLDVSGSMLDPATGGGTKIAKLKTAGDDFIDTMVTNASPDSVTSVSIVPYSSNVALPQNMWDEYTMENLHNNRRCVVFDDSTYNGASVPLNVTLPQLSYFKTTSISFGGGGQTTASDYNWCNPASGSEIMAFSTDDVALKAKISNLVALGGTATHIGTKWGVALLDPTARDVAAAIGSANTTGRPYEYTETDVLKVLVVMTDGVNSDHRDIAQAYRSGLSNTYYVENYGSCQGCNGSWTGTFIDSPYNSYFYKIENGAVYSFLPGTAGNQTQLTWPEVWAYTTTNTYAGKIGDSYQTYLIKDRTSSEADTDFDTSCSAAKNNGVLVYTIAFEAPEDAEDLLKDCATSVNHHYNVTGTNISAAFASIAISIQKLKLTQ